MRVSVNRQRKKNQMSGTAARKKEILVKKEIVYECNKVEKQDDSKQDTMKRYRLYAEKLSEKNK